MFQVEKGPPFRSDACRLLDRSCTKQQSCQWSPVAVGSTVRREMQKHNTTTGWNRQQPHPRNFDGIYFLVTPTADVREIIESWGETVCADAVSGVNKLKQNGPQFGRKTKEYHISKQHVTAHRRCAQCRTRYQGPPVSSLTVCSDQLFFPAHRSLSPLS